MFGLAGLFRDRFEAGDIYPAYSTLRSDPMGCQALYQALRKYPGVEVSRVFSEADYRSRGPGSVVLVFGGRARPRGLQAAGMKALDSLAREGNRIVLSFAPEDLHGDPMPEDSIETKLDSGKAAGTPPVPGKSPPAVRAAARVPGPSLGFRLDQDTSREMASSAASVRDTQDTLPWISRLYFDSLASPWSILYRRDSLPVMVERSLGKGSMVLIADSYWASNEALFGFLPGRLLSGLVAGHTRLLFDERHLGLRRDDSLVDLLVRYRLHLLLPSLLLLLLAYFWKIRSAFDPSEMAAAASQSIPEPLDGTGMAGLLRRNISPGDLIGNCYSQWKETEGVSSPIVRRVDAEVGKLLAGNADARDASLIEDYRKIQSLINQRNSK